MKALEFERCRSDVIGVGSVLHMPHWLEPGIEVGVLLTDEDV